jgi:hypothetical protein
MVLAMHRVCDTWNMACVSHSVAVSDRIAEGPKARANLLDKQLRLFPGREVSALVELVVVDQLGIRLLHPAPRRLLELIREGARRHRDLHALRREEAELVFPVEPRSPSRLSWLGMRGRGIG